MRRVYPYLLVVLAAWTGSYLWYEQNEDRRDQTVARLVTEQYSEDVDSCKRVNVTVREPTHQFFLDVARNRGIKRSIPKIHSDAQAAERAMRAKDCLKAIGKPEEATGYEPDANEIQGIREGLYRALVGEPNGRQP